MNCEIYIFGHKNSIEFYYPNNSICKLTDRFVNHMYGNSQIVTHQEKDILSYVYLRGLESGSYFGLSYQFNQVITDQIRTLFKISEKIIEKLAIDGSLLCFTKDGKIEINEIADVNRNQISANIIEDLKVQIEEGEHTFFPIKHSTYSAPDSDDVYVEVDNTTGINFKSLLSTNRTVYFVKNLDINSIQMNTYSSVLAKLEEELNMYKQRVHELESIKIKKNSYSALLIVLFLLLLICICFIYHLLS